MLDKQNAMPADEKAAAEKPVSENVVAENAVAENAVADDGAAEAAPINRLKMQFEDWEELFPLLRQPVIDYDAVTACMKKIFEERQQILWQNIQALRALKRGLDGLPADLAQTKLFTAKMVISFIVSSGYVNVARDYVMAAQKHWDETRFREPVAGLFPPSWHGGEPSMLDRKWVDYQIFDRGKKTTLLLFGGVGGHFGFELNAMLMWLDAVDCNVIVMRDMHRALFFSGIKSIGDFDQTVAAIKEDVKRLGGERLVCMGSSGGGYNALHFGDLLKADMVMSFAGPTTLEYGKDNAEDRPIYAKLTQRIEAGELVEPNLVEAYRRNGIPVRIYHGADMPRDTMEAARFKEVPTAQVLPVAGWHLHHVYGELARRGELAGILAAIATG